MGTASSSMKEWEKDDMSRAIVERAQRRRTGDERGRERGRIEKGVETAGTQNSGEDGDRGASVREAG